MELRQRLAEGWLLGLRNELRLLPKILLRLRLLRERKRLLTKVLLGQGLSKVRLRRNRQTRVGIIKDRLIVELGLRLEDLPLLSKKISLKGS